MSKDDQDWLNALAGRPDASAEPDTNRRAAALRQAMLALREKEIAESPEMGAHDGGLDRLLFRLRREGLLEKEAKPWLKGFPAMFAMAATVLLVAGLGWMVMLKRNASIPEGIEPPVPKEAAETGGPDAPQPLLADNPDELAANLAQDFAAAGITLAQSQSGDAIRLEGNLPANLSADVLRLIDRYKLSIPEGRTLIIEIHRHAAQ